MYDEATDEGVISIPLADGWQDRPFMTQLVPVLTRTRYENYLAWHLGLAGMAADPIGFPTVPKGESRVRLVFHAHNTLAETEAVAATICDWAAEILAIERGESNFSMPSAARKVFAMHGPM